jgi:hypothetical protein
MWFLSKKIPKEIVSSRIFEFKGAVQTCDLDVVKFSLKVLTIDLGEVIKESSFYKEIENFDDSITPSGSRRKILYNAFENLLLSFKYKNDIKFNELAQMPHGFSCPKSKDKNNLDYQSYWINALSLKLNLNESEIKTRVQKFSDFILDENYNTDDLNDIKWHKSDLTSDIVSGSAFARDTEKLGQWQDFEDSILSFGKLSVEQKNISIIKFTEMLKYLPYNNFSY